MKSKNLKRQVNRRRKEGESTKQAARRIMNSAEKSDLQPQIKQWLSNKKPPSTKRTKPKKEAAPVQETKNNVPKVKRK